MRLIDPTPIQRLNEAIGVVFLFLSLFLTLSLVSYHPSDPSWNTTTGPVAPGNLTGSIGSHLADLLLQSFGLASFLLPLCILILAWKWIRSQAINHQLLRLAGFLLMLASVSATLSLLPDWSLFGGVIAPGGIVGMVISDYLVSVLNMAGSVLVIWVVLLISLYLVSSFSLFGVRTRVHGGVEIGNAVNGWWQLWRERRRQRAARKTEKRALDEEESDLEQRARQRAERMARNLGTQSFPEEEPPAVEQEPAILADDEIPIRTLEDMPPPPSPEHETVAGAGTATTDPAPSLTRPYAPPAAFEQAEFRLPATELLNEGAARSPYDEQELKSLAGAIKSKFDEFNVRGSVTQINHGPVVTTFEFKPEAGIKYSRITSLTDDLCLGLEAESILIERIPGKPTVGIEVPNSKRELIVLRQVLESEEFRNSKSKLPVPLGKDINGRIKVAALEAMPHLLIAGSTGSGKSVMLNSLLMSTLYRATPDEVRMILVDPKRVELGIYDDVPHLLTPVITDPRQATNALRNAVQEMERRYKLLASFHVRNLEQYNRKVRKLLDKPRSLFPEAEDAGIEQPQPLPYILIVIDELADLMMVERANVEASVARLSQMARAVGVHLVLATQRPSVDVITGLIKNNLPARISFRVATRFDSRTIIDIMGAERLLGRGDMLFLPPGTSRLIRMHGPYVTEEEIAQVVDFWKDQALPDYDESFLVTPDEDAGTGGDELGEAGSDDPMYQEAVRVVLEMGKASTSILQRRLRVGYGRAARLLDIMQHEGIIGPPDGSRPREVLKSPDWLEEVEQQLR